MKSLFSSRARGWCSALTLAAVACIALAGLSPGSNVQAAGHGANLPLPTLTILPTLPLPTVPLPTVPVPTLQPTLILPTVGVTVPAPVVTVQPTVVINPTQVAVGAATTLGLCGPVTAFVSPTGLGTGSITIAGQTLQIAPGASFSGAGVTVGSNLCITFSLNAAGQVSGGSVSANAGAALHICGPVSAFTSPTALSTGSLTIGGQTLQLAPGATLSGAQLVAGSNVCLDAQTNPQGQITNGTASASAPTSLSLCGVVDAFTPPTNAGTGSLTVAGQTLVLAPGATFTGGSIVTGSNLCATFTTNPQGQITGGSVTVSAPTTLNLCGVVSGYTAPTSLNAGSLTIGGQTLAIAPGTTLQGAAITVGSNLCAALATNPQGQVSGGTITAQVPVNGTVCGIVTAYAPPTAVSAGTITIGGQTYVLPAGWLPTSAIQIGTSACLQVPGGGSSATPTPTGVVLGTSVGATPTATPTATATGSGGGTGGSSSPTPVGSKGGSSATPTPSAGNGGAGGTPGGNARGNLTEYALPHGAAPWHLAWDQHHNLWMTEINRGSLAELVAGTHTLREYRLGSMATRPHPLAIDKKGDVWVGESGTGRIDEVIPHGTRARLIRWTLPQRRSDVEGVTVASDGTVWIAEGAGRLGWLNPRTGRLDEYGLGAGNHPHAVGMSSTGPVLVNEEGDSAMWIHALANHRVRLSRMMMPSRAALPTHLAVMPSGIAATERGADALAWLDGGRSSGWTLRPATHKLKARAGTLRAVQTGLRAYHYSITPMRYRVVSRRGRHWAEWRLPNGNSRPYAVVQANNGSRLWITEARSSCVGLLQPARHRLLEYKLPQKHAMPTGIQIRTTRHGTQVWLALYGLDRLGLLTTP